MWKVMEALAQKRNASRQLQLSRQMSGRVRRAGQSPG